MTYLCHKCKLIFKDTLVCPACNRATQKSDTEADVFYLSGYIGFRIIPSDTSHLLRSDFISSDNKKNDCD